LPRRVFIANSRRKDIASGKCYHAPQDPVRYALNLQNRSLESTKRSPAGLLATQELPAPRRFAARRELGYNEERRRGGTDLTSING
jgi:hypothetical protein